MQIHFLVSPQGEEVHASVLAVQSLDVATEPRQTELIEERSKDFELVALIQ